jgi:hypothetical protein
MEQIYQASDLASKRRELLDAARLGVAQIRDTDGMGLVMLPQGRFELLRALRELLGRFLALEGTLERAPAERRVTDYGELAWLMVFDEDDQRSFRREFLEALVQSLANESVEPAERCISEWRTTARALSNDQRRRILTSPGDDAAAFEEVARPG